MTVEYSALTMANPESSRLTAASLLLRYQAGERNFCGADLRGLDLRSADLSYCDFSQADLRGTRLAGSRLRGARLAGCRTGARLPCQLVRLLVMLLMATGSALCQFMITAMGTTVLTEKAVPWFGKLGMLIVLCGWGGWGVRRGFSAASMSFLLIFAFAVAFAIAFALAGSAGGEVAMAFAGAVVVVGAVGCADAGAGFVAGVGSIVGAIASSILLTDAGAGAIAVAVGMAILFSYLRWRALHGDPRDAWRREVALWFERLGRTDLRGADLIECDFSGTQLRGVDLQGARLWRTRFSGAQGLIRALFGDRAALRGAAAARRDAVQCRAEFFWPAARGGGHFRRPAAGLQPARL